ncbi:hypothetical protein TNCT_446121 [Trichonephila clavata]|uniref:Uncharacterized protein n=1 Tax=Trichonephila clavata TaxID=2740835 RepID=A0A8X6LP61_TRICU|nr:hypothetical protein TNCT_446121 [Trichonephila clavata]
MPDMDVDPPDRQTLCSKREELLSTIETSGILIENFNEVINVPDTPQNLQMKEIVKRQIMEHQQGKDAAIAELDSIPPCNNQNCCQCSINLLHLTPPSPMHEEPLIIDENPPVKSDKCESAEISLPKRKPKKKRKKAKDVTDDFVFPKLQVISRILKRSPEILKLLPKLKQAEKDNNAAYVLVEALLDKN